MFSECCVLLQSVNIFRVVNCGRFAKDFLLFLPFKHVFLSQSNLLGISVKSSHCDSLLVNADVASCYDINMLVYQSLDLRIC